MRAMLAKISAAALLVLVVSPCTSPFSTCDVATLLTECASLGRVRAPVTRSRTASLTDASLSQDVSLARTAGRVRLLMPFRTSRVTAVARQLVATRLDAAASACIAIQPVFQTILRI
jgi:hypothetical protein